MTPTTRYILSTVIEVFGLIVVTAGVALVSVPAAVIVGGLFVVLLGIAVDPPASRRKGPSS